MAPPHVVVDGSNLATEGRTLPSLAQLDEAVEAFAAEHPGVTITVVVDASFPHRIDPGERDAYEAEAASGAIVSPPAGAIGRGDGFLLQIADRTHGVVLSNDSFQEFHGTYDWLFDPGRLVGAKPVPGVGWIFSLRTPVRGERSRRAVKEAAEPVKTPRRVAEAIREASADALAPDAAKRRRRAKAAPGAVNDPDPFVRFVATHPPGTEVEGRVDAYASHGAFVEVDGVRAYVPLAALGEPPPASAREALQKGEARRFVVQAVDAPRRGVELALPEFAHVSGAPSPETVEAGIREGSERTKRRRRQRKAAKERARTAKAPRKAKGPGKAKEPRKAKAPRRAAAGRSPKAEKPARPAKKAEKPPKKAAQKVANRTKRAAATEVAKEQPVQAPPEPPARPGKRRRPR
ncbi:MAG TPA: S1 RNA-binding domain-containing protein [Acidimicrobiia bacterium]